MSATSTPDLQTPLDTSSLEEAPETPTSPEELKEETRKLSHARRRHPKGSYVGSMAVDSGGRIGVITGRKRGQWTGYGWVDQLPWSAKHARKLSDQDVRWLLLIRARALQADELEGEVAELRERIERGGIVQRIGRFFRGSESGEVEPAGEAAAAA